MLFYLFLQCSSTPKALTWRAVTNPLCHVLRGTMLMTFNLRDEDSECVSMTWRAVPAWPCDGVDFYIKQLRHERMRVGTHG